MIVSEIFVIEDCLDSDTLTSDHSKFTPTSVNVSYDSTGLSVTGNANADCRYAYNGTLPTNYEFEVDVVSITYGTYSVGADVRANGVRITNRLDDSTYKTVIYYGSNSYTQYNLHSPPFHLKGVVSNGNVSYYIDDTLIDTKPSSTTDFGVGAYNNRGIKIKNLKIKPL